MANRSPLASSRRSIERLRLRTKGMDFLDLFPRDIKKYIAQGNPRPSSLYCDVSDEIIRTISVSGEGRMSRLTKPSVIFRERVVPAYSEYLKDPLSERRANTLAEALNNTVEWTYLYLNEVDPARLNGATLTSFRTGLLTEHRALHVMSDLADAAQHRELTFERKPARVVTLSTDAYYAKQGVLHVQGFNTPFPSEAREAFEFWRGWRD
jgi:hypothetical protein